MSFRSHFVQTLTRLACASSLAFGRRADRWRRVANRARLGCPFQCQGCQWSFEGKAPVAPSILDNHQRQASRQTVEEGPIPAIHGVVRWRLIDLARSIFEEFVLISKQTLSRELRRMGFRELLGTTAPSRARRGSRTGIKKKISPP